MSDVLITGVTGRIGANLATALLAKGYHVRGTVMPSDPKATKVDNLDIETIECDIRDLDSVLKASRGVDAVIHLAAYMTRTDPLVPRREYIETNILGTWDVAYAAGRASRNLQRFVYVSTDATYGPYQARYTPMDELHPQDPIPPYGFEKLLGEHIVRHFQRLEGLPAVVCRLGNVLAADQILTRFTAKDAIRILKEGQHRGSATAIEGIDEPWRLIEEQVDNLDIYLIPRNQKGESWIHHPTDVRDTVAGIILALEKEEAVGEAFNMLAAGCVSWQDVVEYIHKRTGQSYAEVTLPNRWIFCCDVSKARKVLGYHPQFDYRRMIDDAVAFRQGTDIGVIPA
jgi:UDP-glucose 4-epimerase